MKTTAMEQEAVRVADEFAPVLLTGNRTLVVIVCDDDGWFMSMRGSRAHATVALEGALGDLRDGPVYETREVPSA